jgi:hypothetical protein
MLKRKEIVKMMQVTDAVPYGHENAVTREELVRRTGMPDRFIREAISRSDELIINLQDGKGYFKPLPEETDLVDAWVRLFRARIRDENRRLRKAKAWYA